jgi:homoserine dehydrogenase
LPIPPESSSPKIRIALAGLGTVGTAVIRLLQEERERLRQLVGADLKLELVFDRSHQSKDIAWMGPGIRVTDSVDEFLSGLANQADIVVELIGGTDVADRILREGLAHRKAVITANKLLMARSGGPYLELADKNHAFLGFEASVAGGVPILRALGRSLIADQILSIRGILNGTCNFILSEMAESGREFGTVLAQAQSLGFAEANPELDVSGRDTADKLAILAALAFGQWVHPDEIPTQGISEIQPVDFLYARRLNATIRMLGVARLHEKKLSLWAGPFLVDRRLPLCKISGVSNAVEVNGARLGSALFSGEGAGGNPTSVSVVADILNAALWRQGKARFSVPRVAPAASGNPGKEEYFPYYFRFFIEDRPGIIAELADILARHDINIDSVLQESWPDRSHLPFVISVDPTPHSTIERALADMGDLGFMKAPPVVLPILSA